MGNLWTCPREETVAVIERFGKYSHIAYPGVQTRVARDVLWINLEQVTKLCRIIAACNRMGRQNPFTKTNSEPPMPGVGFVLAWPLVYAAA
jgi:hypothetical protein